MLVARTGLLGTSEVVGAVLTIGVGLIRSDDDGDDIGRPITEEGGKGREGWIGVEGKVEEAVEDTKEGPLQGSREETEK